ncbi:MAG: protein phosphatase 2C domain-containing protein, partial [Gemmatimonadota bacterium]|nr:protein phosphatase 2C domain-containing protein [Gemmatimonadota bacterium]
SLTNLGELPVAEDRLASLMMIADGVGGGKKGEAASQLALEEVTQYITQSVRCYYSADTGDSDFTKALEAGAIECHRAVLARGASDPGTAGMATTLTLWIGVWPWCYLVQVGDSRYYQFRQGNLTQISRDQTMAQDLLDTGTFAKAVLASSPLANVLTSSIGGHQTAPVVKRLPNSWSTIHLLCSDGLTRHVPDERIAERLGAMKSARQVCEDLLQDALDGGGTDNITITVGRATPVDSGSPPAA